MSNKHESFLSFPSKNDKSPMTKDQFFRNKGVDPILSSISPPKQSNQTKISTIAESIAKSLLGGDNNTKNELSDEYSDEEEAKHDDLIKENKNKNENDIIFNDKKATKQEKSESSTNTEENTNFNSPVENTKNSNSSSYEYFEEEEDIDEEQILLQEIKTQKEKEIEKKKKEEEEEKEINEKMRLLEIEIIQPNKEDDKYLNSENYNDNESFQSKYEIIEEEPEKIEIIDDAQIDLKPKELFSSVGSNHDLSSSISPTSSPTHSPSPNSAPVKNSNKKKVNQNNSQHYSIFDITSPKYDLKTPDIRSSKKFSKMKRKTKSIINVNEIKDQETFRKYLNGELDYPKPQGENYMCYFKQKRHYNSYLSHQEILDICERLISTPIEKSKYKIENPGDISVIIDELKRLKVESITNGDYSRSKKIDDLINYLRTQYRVIDREMFHKASLQGIERKLDEIKNQIIEMHGKYVLYF